MTPKKKKKDSSQLEQVLEIDSFIAEKSPNIVIWRAMS